MGDLGNWGWRCVACGARTCDSWATLSPSTGGGHVNAFGDDYRSGVGLVGDWRRAWY